MLYLRKTEQHSCSISRNARASDGGKRSFDKSLVFSGSSANRKLMGGYEDTMLELAQVPSDGRRSGDGELCVESEVVRLSE